MKVVSTFVLVTLAVAATILPTPGEASGSSGPAPIIKSVTALPRTMRWKTTHHNAISADLSESRIELLPLTSTSAAAATLEADEDDHDHHHNHHHHVRGGAAVAESPAVSGLINRLIVGFYFALWFALNTYYNIINKQLLNILPAPLTVGSIQLGVGALYASLIWLVKLRPRPTLTAQGRAATNQVGLWHAIGQEASMVSLGAGPVSFTHIVKALEPFFSAIVSGLMFQKWMPLPVYATLIPVVGGVGYACLKERSFSWLAFATAMLSNLAFALRAVLSKVAMSSSTPVPVGTNLSAPNVFGLVTISAFFLSIPMALITEGATFQSQWKNAIQSQQATSPNYGAIDLVKAIVITGFFHYINNEVMYLALGKVHPITLAVGNTMKRVFILVASVLVFRNEITIQAGIGSAVGLAGVLLYSITTQYYETLEKEKQQQNKAKEQVVVATSKPVATKRTSKS